MLQHTLNTNLESKTSQYQLLTGHGGLSLIAERFLGWSSPLKLLLIPSLHFKVTVLCHILLLVIQMMAQNPLCPQDKAAGPPLGHWRSCAHPWSRTGASWAHADLGACSDISRQQGLSTNPGSVVLCKSCATHCCRISDRRHGLKKSLGESPWDISISDHEQQ